MLFMPWVITTFALSLAILWLLSLIIVGVFAYGAGGRDEVTRLVAQSRKRRWSDG